MRSLSQHINESILSSSGAGKAKVNAEYEKYGLDPDKVKLNSDGTIDYDGDVDISQCGLKRIPFNFNKVNGYFMCSYNKLTTLDGCPKIVNGTFACAYNNLKSLKGCPETIKWSFDCKGNRLTSLDGCPKIVDGDFLCAYNGLTTLEGGPLTVGGMFNCNDNNLTNLKGGPEIVGDAYLCYDNDFNFNLQEFFDNMPKSVGGNFSTSTKHSIGVDMETLKKMIRKSGHVKGYIRINVKK